MPRAPTGTYFMFATGIENSYPTVDGGRTRMDEMALCRFYDLWRRDFDLVKEIGVNYLRYGPPLHTTWLGHDRYDWAFADQTFGDLKRRDITPITDLCHFGVPDWIGNFQNPEFPQLFAEYFHADCPAAIGPAEMLNEIRGAGGTSARHPRQRRAAGRRGHPHAVGQSQREGGNREGGPRGRR